MKYLLLLLISFNCFPAHWKVELEGLGSKMEITASSDSELTEKLNKWAVMNKSFKGEWVEDVAGTMASKEVSIGWESLAGQEPVELFQTLYYKPVNFTFTKTDITSDVVAKEAVKQARKDDIIEVKSIDVDSLPVSPQLKQILKRLVSELKE